MAGSCSLKGGGDKSVQNGSLIDLRREGGTKAFENLGKRLEPEEGTTRARPFNASGAHVCFCKAMSATAVCWSTMVSQRSSKRENPLWRAVACKSAGQRGRAVALREARRQHPVLHECPMA
eukprot:175119-Chlamydomonas_euryale.AAC.1